MRNAVTCPKAPLLPRGLKNESQPWTHGRRPHSHFAGIFGAENPVPWDLL